jgi:L-aspartate oxidase
VRELVQIGARFDRARGGELSLTREGGHHRDRIAHAGGDATGAEIHRALVTRVLDATAVSVIEHALVLDLLQHAAGAVAGLTLHVMGEGQLDGIGAVRARAVVLATGGIGQVYASTTNPSVSTGDGVAAALRAGAVVRDLEFVQFHPTVTWLGARSRGQQPLVSEAVRGEGAFLVDDDGLRFMTGRHELADLAPRDVVAKAILRRMRETGADHMWLDARRCGAEKWRVRFPTIHETLLSLGIDPVRELIPVVPACHYASGGVRTDLYGESSLPGLFVCGESASTGVHGANRLASNSLVEGLVFGRRIAQTVVARLGDPATAPGDLVAPAEPGPLLHEDARAELQSLMSANVGVLRDAKGLHAATDGLAALAERDGGTAGTEAWETTNLLTVASALVQAATVREETRGAHWRDDFPDLDDARWRGHLDTVLSADATLQTRFASVRAAECKP